MARTVPPQNDQPEPDPGTSDSGFTLDIFGTLVTFQIRSAETNGAYSILEMTLPNDTSPPRMHLHSASETFQILDGELEFHTIRNGHPATFSAAVGDIVHMPPHVPHGFRNISKSPAKCQIIIAPGSMEGYFLELGTPTVSTRPKAKPMTSQNTHHLLEIAAKYGIEFVTME